MNNEQLIRELQKISRMVYEDFNGKSSLIHAQRRESKERLLALIQQLKGGRPA